MNTGHRSDKGVWPTCSERGIDWFKILEEKMAEYYCRNIMGVCQ